MIKKKCYKSSCGRYRWTLDLELSRKNRTHIIFIGLNPSLSDNEFIDNTTKKIINISENYNYSRITIINLFALISKSPKTLFSDRDPVGILNNKVINEILGYWSQTRSCNLWLGWGNNGNYLDRNKYLLKTLSPYFKSKIKNFDDTLGPLHIKKTINLNPIHPLYCPNKSQLIEYSL